MAFNHNDFYHRLLTRQLPPGARTALDVGCGTGRFARRMAARGIAVTALDSSSAVIEAAREAAAGMAGLTFRRQDLAETELPDRAYDVISCLASLHHLPFETVGRLRAALAPGGVLLVLGCAPEESAVDWAWSLTAVPVNAVFRVTVAAGEWLRGGAPAEVAAPVAPPRLPYAEVRRQAALLLPGARVRRLLFWRYLLVYRAPA
ncbi:class I SAM-dependent methyltransferase [Kitasatospora sp. NBC_01287]|uniref:class I SAM-dependent methyltransferase n=1 Tax=Kitasatospora sp. NBC_01287 TaxID=2903573 RepID=UPI0022544798|nr:class I SAM-dependent methyltransferase [Kitasatospora sp. NBC_01287]MCX4750726.1 class I SAM-dependent methyltransferase [Kitasatospora sp. NBC_01287]